MHSLILRYAACTALLVSATACGVQAPQANAAATTAGTASLPDFTGIVEHNAPAVVQVEAKYTGGKQASQRPMNGQMGPRQGMPGGPQADILRQLFGLPMMPSPEEQKHTSLGSGFIISKDGYILTNNHVVTGADKVTVRLQDRRTLTAKVVGTDPTYDIALLKIDAGNGLPTVSIGDSGTLKPGQWVLAIGSPFGFDYTVTQGIVSAVGRSLGERSQEYTSFIQTDVPINRGNSGGPLFNLQGKVVGINSQIYSNTGDYLGVSFSIPINVAMNAVEQIKTKGYVSRGMLGVLVQPVSDDMVKALGLDNGTGAAVTQVTPNSAASKAGIQAGDIILSFDGHVVEQTADLPPMVGMTKPGTRVPVEIMRDGKKQTLQVTVGESPRDQGAVANSSATGATASTGAAALGLTVQSLDSDTRQQLGLKAGEGVVISDITGPVAAEGGLQAGDVVLMVNQKKIGSVAEFEAATKDVKAGSTVLLLVRRGDQSRFIGLTVPDAKK
jgi:serine protease Do